MELDDYRREYTAGGLRREDLADSPLAHFEVWLKQAITAGIQDPTAMSLATVGEDGQPWQRIVLLKHSDERGFIFYTNLGSQKAKEIAHEARVCLLFPWLGLDRQVIIGGVATRLSSAEALRYFVTRPRESQLAAWASRQSHALSTRQILESKFAEMKQRFAKGEVPLPSFWGGYRVVPETFEFWQGRPSRMHDRFRYHADGDAWRIERLAP